MRLSYAPACIGGLLFAAGGCGKGGGGAASTSITFVNESLAGGPTPTSISVNDDGPVTDPRSGAFPSCCPPSR